MKFDFFRHDREISQHQQELEEMKSEMRRAFLEKHPTDLLALGFLVEEQFLFVWFYLSCFSMPAVENSLPEDQHTENREPTKKESARRFTLEYRQ